MTVSRLGRLARAPQRLWQFRQGLVKRIMSRSTFWLGALRGSRPWREAILRYGELRGQVYHDNFLILGAARSGTTALVDYLNCHPQIQCRGEILNGDYGYYGNPRRLDVWQLKRHVQSYFLKRRGKLAGAKFLTYQIDELPIELREILFLLSRPKVIVIYRQDLLEQFASLKLARRSGVWHGKKPRNEAPIWLDPQEFSAYAQRERRMWRVQLAGLDRVSVHFLTHRDLIADPQGEMSAVFQFLELTPVTVDSFVKPLHSQPLAERVSNFEQFDRAGLVTSSWLELHQQTAAPPKAA